MQFGVEAAGSGFYLSARGRGRGCGRESEAEGSAGIREEQDAELEARLLGLEGCVCQVAIALLLMELGFKLAALTGGNG